MLSQKGTLKIIISNKTEQGLDGRKNIAFQAIKDAEAHSIQKVPSNVGGILWTKVYYMSCFKSCHPLHGMQFDFFFFFYFFKSLWLKVLLMFLFIPHWPLLAHHCPSPQTFTSLLPVSMDYAYIHTGSLVNLLPPTLPSLCGSTVCSMLLCHSSPFYKFGFKYAQFF